MTDKEIRLECLRLALSTRSGLKTELVIEQAEAYARFITGNSLALQQPSSQQQKS